MSKRKRGTPRPPAQPNQPGSLGSESQVERDLPEGDAAAEFAAPVEYRPIDLELEYGATEAPHEKDLTGLMKAWRKGRATTNIFEVLQDGYVAIFALAMFGAMIANLIIRTQQNASACVSESCLAGRTIVPWATIAGFMALALFASRLFGPVLASAAEGFWLFDAPIRRSRLLGGRLVAIVVGSGLIGAGLGALVALITGSAAPGVGMWAAATGLGAAGCVAFAAAEQGASRTRLVRVAQALFSAIGIGALLLVVAITAGWLPTTFVSLDARSLLVPSVVAAAGMLVLVLSIVVAARRLGDIHRARLVSGGALVSGMQGAAFALDLGLMRDILVEREAVARGRVKPRRGHGKGTTALVWRDLQRLLRFPLPLVTLAVTAVVPYAVDALGLGMINTLLSGIVLCFALVPVMGQLRVLSRTPGLARTMPFSTSQMRTAAMVVPAVLALLWSAAVIPAYMGLSTSDAAHRSPADAAQVALVSGLAGLLGAVRWVTAGSAKFDTPMMATPMGAMPPSLIFNLIRGFDMVILITAPILFNIGPIWSLAIAAVIFLFLRSGGINREDLMEQQAEQQRQLQAAKQQQNKEKIRVRR